jgi:hypothetical protein
MNQTEKWAFILARLHRADHFRLTKPVSPEQEQCVLYFSGHGILEEVGIYAYKLTPKGKALVVKFREQEAVLRKGIPVEKRMETHPESKLFYRDEKRIVWIRGSTKDNGKYQTDRGVIVSGHPTFGFTGGVFTDALPQQMGDTVDELIYYFLTSQTQWTHVKACRFQRRTLGNIGLIWFVSEDKRIWLPIHDLYYDMLLVHWKRFDTDPLFFAASKPDSDLPMLLVRYSEGTRFKGDLVAIVAGMDVTADLKKWVRNE